MVDRALDGKRLEVYGDKLCRLSTNSFQDSRVFQTLIAKARTMKKLVVFAFAAVLCAPAVGDKATHRAALAKRKATKVYLKEKRAGKLSKPKSKKEYDLLKRIAKAQKAMPKKLQLPQCATDSARSLLTWHAAMGLQLDKQGKQTAVEYLLSPTKEVTTAKPEPVSDELRELARKAGVELED